MKKEIVSKSSLDHGKIHTQIKKKIMLSVERGVEHHAEKLKQKNNFSQIKKKNWNRPCRLDFTEIQR